MQIESSSFLYFYCLNIEVSATAHSLHIPWHLLSEDYFEVFQSLIQLLQAFFLLLSSTSCDSTRSIFCCFFFSAVNFCSSISAKYLNPAFLTELISSIEHGNFRTLPALINSSFRNRSKTMDFSFITYPCLCKSCLLIKNPCSG